MIPELRIEDYNYPLPDERIAKYPLLERDSSKLLRYENGKVSEYVFRDIPGLLPDNAIMVFKTKMVGTDIERWCSSFTRKRHFASMGKDFSISICFPSMEMLT